MIQNLKYALHPILQEKDPSPEAVVDVLLDEVNNQGKIRIHTSSFSRLFTHSPLFLTQVVKDVQNWWQTRDSSIHAACGDDVSIAAFSLSIVSKE